MNKCWTTVVGMVWVVGAMMAGPLGTAFTYQGRLSEGGVPAEGGYDLRFGLYAEPAGGVAAHGWVTNLSVGVVNGLFVTPVDFGGGAFGGTAWWLEVGVRRAGTLGEFVALAPRSPLGSVPNALYAARADQAEVANLAASLFWNSLLDMPAGFADGVDNDTVYGAGAGLRLTGTTFAIAPGGVGSVELADGSVGTLELGDGVVTTAKLADGSVDTLKLQLEAVTLDKLNTGGTVPGAVVLYDGTNTLWRRLGWSQVDGVPAGFADGVDNDTVYGAGAGLSLTGTTFAIAPGGVGSVELGDGAVTTAKLGIGAVTPDRLGTNGAVEGAVLAFNGAGAGWRRLGWSQVDGVPAGFADGVDNDTVYGAGAGLRLTGTTFAIAPGGVGAVELAAGSVGAVKLGDGAVTTAKLGIGAVTPDRLGTNGAVEGAVLAFNGAGPGWRRLGWSQVDGVPAGFADGVDNDTVYGAGVGLSLTGTTFAIAPGGVGAVELGDGAVTTAKLGIGAVTPDRLGTNGAVEGALLAFDGVGVGWRRLSWSQVDGVPPGFADGVDNDTVYGAGVGLSLTGTTFAIAPGGVGAVELGDGAVTTVKIGVGAVTPDRLGTNGAVEGAVLAFNGAGAGWRRLGWSQVDGVPAGFADGVDDDTTYGAGAGLVLVGGEFAVAFGGSGVAATVARSDHDHAGVYVGVTDLAGGDVTGPHGGMVVTGLQGRPVGTNTPAVGEVLKWTGERWEAAEDAAASGDITGVVAAEGLTGGGGAGEVSLAVAFGGSGVAGTVARSDHDHAGVYAPVGHGHSGADILTGTVAAARIDGVIARDNEVFPIVLASDGPGSALNADLLDGIQAAGFWQLGGNGQTTAGQHFLGTTDDRPLEFRANNVGLMRLESEGAVRLLTNAGPTKVVSVGDRYRDNGVVAWARVGSDGSVVSDFGVASVSRLSAGVYEVTLDATAQDAAHLVPVVTPRVEGPPDSAEKVRIPSVNPVTGQVKVFQVYINNGAYALVDSEFVLMVSAR